MILSSDLHRMALWTVPASKIKGAEGLTKVHPREILARSGLARGSGIKVCRRRAIKTMRWREVTGLPSARLGPKGTGLLIQETHLPDPSAGQPVAPGEPNGG